jgi:hypothetical protein
LILNFPVTPTSATTGPGEGEVVSSGRFVAVLGAVGAILLGTAVPANAAFADRAAVTTAVSTVLVEPPGDVTLTLASCRGIWMQVQLAWTGSGTPGVSGYTSSLMFNGQPTQVQSGQGATSVTVKVTKPNAATSVTAVAAVTTQTAYGWTAASGQTPPVTC